MAEEYNDILTHQENIDLYNNDDLEKTENDYISNESIHHLLQNYEEEQLNIVDNVSTFDEKLNDFRYIEMQSVISNKNVSKESNKKIKTHILFYLENQIDIIQQNFEKITHKQFDQSLYQNDEYKEDLKNKLESILGFSINEYNQKTLHIENSIEKICNEIEELMNKLHDYIHHLHILHYKINFISKYENMESEYDQLYTFTNLIDTYEKNIKDSLEKKTLDFIKNHTQMIHDRFNMIQLLQENLYQKVITKYSCGVCLSNNIDCYYTNCGHVICKCCGIKNRNVNICPFCKREGVLKQLFFI